MLSNYLKIAFRSLLKNKGYSAINIGGLAVGMAIAMLIGLWVYDEFTYDRYHRNYDRLAQVMQHQSFNGTKGTEKSIPIPLASELQNRYGADFKRLAMVSWAGGHILAYGEKKISKSGHFMDVAMPEMLSLEMVKGDYGALKETNSIMLSARTASALFGTADPMGKTLRLDNKMDVRVTGIYEDLPFNTEFRDLAVIIPWELFVSSQPWVKRARDENQWDNNSFQLFAEVGEHVNMDKLSAKIKFSKRNRMRKDEIASKPEIFLHPMRNWHLRSNWVEGINSGGFIQYVWLFSIVGVFVLMLACINFMNLSTARSEKRAKEVGIRKAVGSLRGQLVNQFFSESYLVVVIAFFCAVILATTLLPSFNEIAFKKIEFPWAQPVFWIISATFIFVTGLLAGSYPALYLSSFQPVKVLKGTFRAGKFASVPRKALVVLQFTVSITLIIGTVIVYQQIQHTKNRPLGYDHNGLIMTSVTAPEFSEKADLILSDLKNSGAIAEVALSSSPLTGVWSNNGGFSWPGKDPNLQADFGTIWVTRDFGKTVGWKFKEGRDFSKEFSTDSSALVVNEAAVKFMGIKEPLGKVVQWGFGKEVEYYTIIGVIKDMIMDSPYEPVKQIFYFTGKASSFMNVKLSPTKSATESIAAVEAVLKKHVPAAPFEYQFVNEEYGKKFSSEERIGKLSAIFAGLAVFISCLGLFGLASFVAEQRIKEIGVRKVLGASILNLWQLMSQDFVLLVIISCLIASPIAYHFLNDWLLTYKYHTVIQWWIFPSAAFCATLITVLTVSYQAIRAALMNPVKSLRSE
ncbi:ABC transporter permease [Dyadobacter arcticus]|uniref:ABC-type antimicrobial peptide transport system permease subunit n=1 Tax=Dyadobacter arcticus TaxID=1078754 RepID=A0ABX0UJS0_9BACT|nr:ABC transporter permease [Dyadobacter arcticus]NIJ51825.1 ABC-type antimicrobial peptide transport system permease subunit [Dyadobacter arcticus]